MALNTADVIIILTIIVSTGIGIYRGFLREILSILTWLVAAVVAYIYGPAFAEYIVFVDNPLISHVLAILAVFMAVVMIGLLVKFILIKIGRFPGISTFDRLAGALFGVLRAYLLIVLLLLVSSKNITTQTWYKDSQFIPIFAQSAEVVSESTPQSWKDELKHELDELVKKQQAPAPVQAAQPTTAPNKK